MSETLFGDSGRREERVEWGVDWPSDEYLHQRGQVNRAVDQEHAERMAAQTYWVRIGRYQGHVVSRVVVTYTTDWEPA